MANNIVPGGPGKPDLLLPKIKTNFVLRDAGSIVSHVRLVEDGFVLDNYEQATRFNEYHEALETIEDLVNKGFIISVEIVKVYRNGNC